MNRLAAVCAALAAAMAGAAAQAPAMEPWPQNAFNRQPSDDDLILPMPCGGSMALRAVATPSEGWLSDRRVLLGGGDARYDFAEGARYDHVAGAFSDPDNPARRVYWLGKYEVTEAQYAAVMGDSCPQPTTAASRPQVEASWFDAVSFSQAYTEWLLAEAADALPREDGATGFVRLPTEAEWEFAARGGLAVSADEFRGRLFPMTGPLAAYAWFEGSRSARGERHPVGLLQANPLGLHDMLGNVDEIVLEPFRLNRAGRLHGQAGGFIARGGDYLTSEGDMRTSYRQEIAHFTAAGPNRVRTIGFRIAIGAPALTSAARLRAIRDEWAALAAGRDALPDAAAPMDDPLAVLRQLGAAVDDPAIAALLDRAALALASDAEQRAGRAGRTAKSLIRLGAFLAANIRLDAELVNLRRTIAGALETVDRESDQARQARESLALSRQALNEKLEFYLETVIVAAENFSDAVIAEQLAALELEFGERDRAAMAPFAILFTRHISAYRSAGEADREAWLDDLSRG